jgi:CRP/FNR family transcriptional regulator
LRMTQEKIAAEMGTAREVINRLLKEFERLGAIENARGVIKLQNESRLKEYYQSN